MAEPARSGESEFVIERPADGLFVVAFPESEHAACDGVWLYRADLVALRDGINRVLAETEER